MSLQGVPSLSGELSEVNPGMMKIRPSWSQRIAQEGWPKGGWKAVTSKNNKRMFPSVLSFLIHKNKWDRFLRPQSTVAEEVISLGWSYGKVKVGRDFLKAVWSNSAQAGPLRAGVQMLCHHPAAEGEVMKSQTILLPRNWSYVVFCSVFLGKKWVPCHVQ